MQGFGGQRTHIISNTDPAEILFQLSSRGIDCGHFNNGTFSLPKDKFAPAFLAAFKRVLDVREDDSSPLIVAINSDKSMKNSFVGKDNEAELVASLVPQTERAEHVVSILYSLYPERQIVAVFYDEETPHELYKALHEGGFGMETLHKVGYGTNPNDKPIIGAEFFGWVYACPLPFDEKPVMHKDTRDATSTDRHPDLIEKLTEVTGPHGAPYITKSGKLLFPVPNSLLQYSDPDARGIASVQPSP